MAYSEDEENVGLLAGFLFGNIDESGNLENDILDEEAKKHLGQLASFGIGPNLVRELGGSSGQYDSDDDGESSGYQQKSLDCVDYSTIDELAEETCDLQKIKDEDDDDYDDDEEDTLVPGTSGKRPHTVANIPLPSIVPKAETMEIIQDDNVSEIFAPASPGECNRDDDDDDDTSQSADPGGPIESCRSSEIDEVKEEKIKEEPPLTGLASLEGKSVTDLFPEFEPGKVLRFSRLFGPKKYVSAQWKGLKKRKRKRKLLGLDTIPKSVGFDLRFGSPPKPEECEPDQAKTHLLPIPLSAYGDQYKYLHVMNDEDTGGHNGDGFCAEWMYGPAEYWYHKHSDLIENGKFNYGFREKSASQKKEEEQLKQNVVMPPEDHFNLVCLTPWEDEIIWSSEEYKPKSNAESVHDLAGWIPSGNIRTMKAYLSQYANKDTSSTKSIVSANILKNFKKANGPILNKDPNSHTISDWYSIFPIENSQLLYERWEDKIIYDSEAVEKLPSPEIFKLDPNDENLILSMPEDIELEDQSPEEQTPKKEYKSKSRFMSKKNQNQGDDDEEPIIRRPPKDIYNLSNDEYYMPKQDLAENKLQADLSSLCIQHATPAVELQRPFFPTHLWPAELRSFHRPHLTKKRLHHKSGFHVAHSLFKRIKKKAKEREKERQAFGGGEMFFMRQPEDLSGMDGGVVLIEYCEEMPPLLSQPGMNTRIRNYYQRKHGKDSNAPVLEYGDITFVHHSPFLGQLAQGQILQALENNLYRAPVYQHKIQSTDFLMFITPYGYYVRNLKDIFTVGQLCPKYEVPGPNSKRANNHIRDFLQIFIYRLFWKSHDTPKRIKMEDIRKAFPKHSESSVRKRLKLCADFRRTGADCNWWVLKNEFRLPSEEEMRNMVTPEQTCAYYMMLAAEQRLQDAGYGERSLFAPDEDDNEDDAKKIDDEIQTAPWNTTRAFIQAMKGKCLLQVTGVADPTGCGEGFSYVRIPNKPVTKDETDEQKQAKKQKLVTGTDADLRRLNLKQARLLLKEFGVPQEEIEKLSRWEVIDKVRTMSTEAAKQGTTEVAMNKFARGSRFTVAEHQEKYKDECQRIFDLQNRVLASDEILSTDEESSGEEGSDIEDLGKNLESMLSNKKISSEEHEEAERRELQKLLSQDIKIEKDISRPGSSLSRQGSSNNTLDKLRGESEETSSLAGCEAHAGRRLIIIRTYKEGGREFVRKETVQNQFVIDAYLRIVTKEKNYREVFASQDEKHKEDMRRERRRIQEQLRRIKRNEERERLRQLQQSMIKDGNDAVIPTPEDQAKLDALCDKPTKSLKCGACHEYGHMKTNKMCPKYTEAPYHSSLTDDELNTEEMSNIAQDDLIKVEGTKIILGRSLLEAHEDMKRKALTIRIPKENVIPLPPPPPKKKRRPTSSTQNNTDYLVRHHKIKKRRRTNPLVALNVLLEQIAIKLKESPDSWPFFTPVSVKSVPDYYNIVKNPMDLQTVRENIKKGVYHARDSFLEHITVIHSNCVLYNGQDHTLTKMAQNLVNMASDELKAKDKELSEIEREINPLLDEDHQVGFSWLCENILCQLKTMPESWPFHQPVPVKVVPDYYDVIKNPVDFQTIKQRCQDHCYQTREAFLGDVSMLYTNSLNYNGAEHAFTKTARRLVKQCEDFVKQYEQKFNDLEANILNQPDDDFASIDPPSVSHSDVLEDDSVEPYPFDPDPFNSTDLHDLSRGTIKQVVTAGDEDEFVDIEGESLLSYRQEHGYVEVPYGEPSDFDNMEYDHDIYGTGYEDQAAYQGFPPELYSETYGTGVNQEVSQGGGVPDENNIDLGLLLLQDLVHSDEDDEESDDDIPLDDGDEDIPLDDGDEEEYELEEEEEPHDKSKGKESDDDDDDNDDIDDIDDIELNERMNHVEVMDEVENESDDEFIDVVDDSGAW